MATDDQQVLVAGTAVAPAIWKVPGNGQIQPKAVFAHYDGSGAAAAFLPALKVTSDGGELVGIYPTCTEVAAGGSAEVSWFPGVKCCPQGDLANFNTSAVALGPWALWQLNEPAGSATAADTSGHGRTLTTIDSSGANSFGTPGLLGSSSQTCDHITFGAATNVYPLETVAPQLFTSATVTLLAWIKSAGGTTHEMTLVALGRLDTEDTWWLKLDASGNPEFDFIDSLGIRQSFIWSISLTDSKTHLLAVSFDGANARAYVDGVLFSTPQPSGGILRVPATHTAYIGQNAGGAGSRMYDGDIGPVVVYDKVLSASDIANLYNQGTGGSAGAGGTGTVTAGDSSIVVGGTATNVTVETASLDVIAADHPTAANWSNNSHKITGLTAGAASGEAATWEETPAGIVTAKGDIVAATGSHAATNLPVGANTNVLTADSTQATGMKWAAAGSGSPLTTKGDIFGHSTVDARIPVGSNNQALIADSTQALGVKWATIGTGGIGGLVQLFDSTLGVDTASIDTGAAGIAAGHGSLYVVMLLRTDEALVLSTGVVTLNNDASAIYDFENSFTSGATSVGQNGVAQTGWPVLVHGNNGSASYASAVTLTIPAYDQATFWKSAWSNEAAADATAGNQGLIVRASGYRSTTAISRMKVAAAGAAKLRAGSRLTIYGTQ